MSSGPSGSDFFYSGRLLPGGAAKERKFARPKTFSHEWLSIQSFSKIEGTAGKVEFFHHGRFKPTDWYPWRLCPQRIVGTLVENDKSIPNPSSRPNESAVPIPGTSYRPRENFFRTSRMPV